MFNAVDTLNIDTSQPAASETEDQRQCSVAWEAAGISKARASVAAGRTVSAEAVEAWIDSLGTEHELPRPRLDE
jgi:predicted transcriptional regulator